MIVPLPEGFKDERKPLIPKDDSENHPVEDLTVLEH